LDDSYTVYHGVHWTNVESKNYAIYGEIDFAVVSPSGKLLLIEQKTGYFDETDDGLEKKYARKIQERPISNRSKCSRLAAPSKASTQKETQFSLIQYLLP
jgi:hypothetical protein